MRGLTCVAAALALVAVGCGGDNDGTPPLASITQAVGPEGGTVELPNGGKVEIPAGALSQTVSIKISEKQQTGQAPLPSNLEVAGKPYSFEPHGQLFSVPVKIEVPFEGDDTEVRPMKLPNESAPTSEWTTVFPSEKSGNKLSLETTSFSVIVPARPRRDSGVVTLPDGAVMTNDAGIVDASAPVDASASDSGVDSGREPLVPLDCPGRGSVSFVFPPNGAATDRDSISVRVRTAPAVNPTSVSIAGVSATQIGATDDWTALVPLTVGDQALTAIAMNADGAEVARFTVDITRLPPQLTVPSCVAAGDANIVYAFADGTYELIEIDLTTEARRVISSTTVGDGGVPGGAWRLAHAPTRNSLVLSDYSNVWEIDLESGDRTIIPPDVVGSTATIGEINGLVVDGNTAWIGSQAATANAMTGPALLSMELDTGRVFIVSGLGVGTGPALRQVNGVALSTATLSMFVLDAALPARIVEIALATGDRTVVAEEGDGMGANFPLADDLVRTSDGSLWIASSTDVVRRATDGTREVVHAGVLPISSGYSMRMALTADEAHLAAVDYRGDAVALIDLADGSSRTFGREPVGPLRLDARPNAIAVGDGRLFYSDDSVEPHALYQFCAADPSLHQLLADDRFPVIANGINYMSFDRSAQELILKGDQLVALHITDHSTRVVGAVPRGFGRMVIADGRAFVVDHDGRAVLAYDLATGAEEVLGSNSVGTGVAFDAPTTVAYDAPRNRLLVVDYLAGVLSLDLTTRTRQTFVPNVGPDALLFPRHMYIRPAANEVRIHSDGNLRYQAADLASGTLGPEVFLEASAQFASSIGEAAFDDDLDLLWIFPSGHSRVVHVIDAITHHGVLVLR